MNLPNYCSLLALILGAVWMPSQSVAGDPVLIEPTWKVGKKYSCEHEQEWTITFGEGDQALENVISVAVDFEASVSDNGDKGDKAVRFKAAKARMSLNMFGQITEYDSTDESKQDPGVGQALRGLLNTDGLAIIYDKDDKFVRFEEKKPVDGGNGEKPKEAAPAGLPLKFGKNEVRQLLSYCVSSFPDKPVKEGDKWTKDEKFNLSLGAADVEMAMTAKAPDKEGRPIVAYETDLEFKLDEGSPVGAGEGKGKIEGEMKYDPDNAIVSEHLTAIDLKVTLGGGLMLPAKIALKTGVTKVEDVKK